MAILLSLCGYPGFGKTTQCENLKVQYGDRAIVLCVPKLLSFNAESISVLTKSEIQDIHRNVYVAKSRMEKGLLVDSFIDELLYSTAARFLRKKDVVILDGSPRDINSLNLFMNLAEIETDNRFIIIYLKAKENEADLSIKRQLYRGEKERILTIADIEQFRNKMQTFEELAKHDIRKILSHNCSKAEYYEIFCEQEKNTIFDEIVNIVHIL